MIEREHNRLSLPPELIVHIAGYASPSSLVQLELLGKAGHQLITEADTILWRQHAVLICNAKPAFNISLFSFVALMKDRCLDKASWDHVTSWKVAYQRISALQENWSTSKTPKTRLDIIGFTRIDPARSALPQPLMRSMTSSRLLNVPYASQNSSYVWRARLDTARDANFVLSTWHTGGLKVVDAASDGQGQVLWELPSWAVRQYAHLEYQKGVACWDGEAGIEIWKRWKLVLGQEGCDEPANKRGQFVKVAVLPDVPYTRGFMLNEDLHLTICSSDGHSLTYDLKPNNPRLLHQYIIPQGAAGHLEHDDSIAIYSMGQKGYVIFQKSDGALMGNIDFSQQSGTLFRTLQDAKESNYCTIDSEKRYPLLARNESQSRFHTPRKEFVTVKLERGSLDQESNVIELMQHESNRNSGEGHEQHKHKRTNQFRLQDDLWGAAMIRKIHDGATLLVARSRGGRILIISDLLGLLTSLLEGNEEEATIKIRQCLTIIECGGYCSRTSFLTGGWLTLHAERAAWEIDNLVYIMPVPSIRNTLPMVGTPLWMIPSSYNDEIPIPSLEIPISFMSLHDDIFLSTYLHPAYVLIQGQDGISRYETTILKSIRILRFHPGKSDERLQEEEEEDNALAPLTNGNKDMHRRWLIASRRLAQAAQEDQEEEDQDWTDDEG